MILSKKRQEIFGKYLAPAGQFTPDLDDEHPTALALTDASVARERSVICSLLHIDGDLRSDGDIEVNGRVAGDVSCVRLTLGRSGCVIGNITADEVVVRGEVKGIIRAARVVMEETACVKSEVFHQELVVERGACFEGVSRVRKYALGMTSDAVIIAAAAQGGDPVALQRLVRPLLSLPDGERSDAVAWATELCLAVQCFDDEVLTAAAGAIAVAGQWCPPIADIIDQCARIDKDIGGQKSMSATMRQLYGMGGGEWPAKWGPLPGKPGCRLRRATQEQIWREVSDLARNGLVETGWSYAPAHVVGLKIIERLERNADMSLEVGGRCAIPRKIRIEYGIPTSAKAIAAARKWLAGREAEGEPAIAAVHDHHDRKKPTTTH